MYKEYIERNGLLEKLEERVSDLRFIVKYEKIHGSVSDEEKAKAKLEKLNEVICLVKSVPTADVVEVIRCKDEKCVICNSEIDEKYADGLWDLAGKICNELLYFYSDEQDIVYNILRNFIERQNYCPQCGTKMDKE